MDVPTELKSINDTLKSLRSTASDWEIFHNHYAAFRKLAVDEIMSPNARLAGLIAKIENDDLCVRYLDRRIRISFAFERNPKKGILRVDDMSEVGTFEEQRPLRIGAISFDYTGATTFDGGSMGRKMTLSEPADALGIALNLVDLVFDHNR